MVAWHRPHQCLGRTSATWRVNRVFIRLLQVDCTANAETCGRFGVSGYPTLKIFRSGKDSAPYDGPRSAGKTQNDEVCGSLYVDMNCSVCVCADGIYEYMKRQTGPDSFHLKTDEDLQAFINNYDASIIGTHTHTDK